MGATIGKPTDNVLLFDLCETVGSAQSHPPQDEYGYLLDRSTADECRLKVSPVQHGQDNDWTPVNLKDVLLRRGESIPRLAFKHKVKLAPLLARSLLQLSSSSWLPNNLTSEHIVFIRRSSTAHFYDSVYILKCLPEKSSEQPPHIEPKFGLPIDYTEEEKRLFSLGVLLMELVLGSTWESIRNSATASFDVDVAEECLPRIQAEGDHYYRAIKCCIKFEFVEPEANLDKAPFRQEVYDKVVGLLEENLS
ncbi:hypothetical protein PG995_013856 [Apiospora arundinis]